MNRKCRAQGLGCRAKAGWSPGVTLTELMVAVAILSVAVLAFISAFRYITVSLHLSRTRTLATNLAQEKIESLKNNTYYKLLLSTATATESRPPIPFDYDTSQYPPETIPIGGITFTRYTLVSLAQVVNDVVSTMTFTNQYDTGMKAITVNVLWQEQGSWKQRTLRNLLENPNINPLDSSMSGAVKANAPGAPVIPGAYVLVEQNPNWNVMTDASGQYSFRVYHGTYTVRASAQGYYTASTTAPAANAGSNAAVPDLLLNPIATGTITGNVWMNPGLVISQVVTSTQLPSGFDLEYVTLFNPTTHQINIADCAPPPGGSCTSASGNPPIQLNIDSHYSSAYPCNNISLIYFSTYVPSGYYYTISNSTSNTPMPIGGQWIRPDAIYNYNLSSPCHPFTTLPSGNSLSLCPTGIFYGWQPTSSPVSTHILVPCRSGSILISDNKTPSQMIDAVGWNNSGVIPSNWSPPWSDCLPNTSYCLPFNMSGTKDGLRPGLQIVRVSSPMANVTPGADLELYGQAYNSGNNTNDFVYYNGGPGNINGILLTHLPQSTTSALLGQGPTPLPPMPVIAGVPAVGAKVSASDPYSGSTVAYAMTLTSGSLNLPYAHFALVGVTTGTWNLEIASAAAPGSLYYQRIATITVNQNVSTGVPNGSTTPSWPAVGVNSVMLTSSTVNGFLNGAVTDVNNNPIPGGVLLSGGGYTWSCDPNTGQFFHSLSSGAAVPVSANVSPTGQAVQYLQVNASFNIQSGQITNSAPFFILGQGGTIKSYVTSGTTPLPNIVITALLGGSLMGSAASDSSGYSYITNIASGTYAVQPSLDVGQAYTASPASGISLSAVVVTTGTVFVGTFTVTGALANITGNFTCNGAIVTTGALLIATLAGDLGPTPPPVTGSTAQQIANPYFSVSTQADGTYTLPVRVANGYTLNYYVPVIQGASVAMNHGVLTGLNVGASGLSGQNIAATGTCP